MALTAQDALLEELAAYYNADELPYFIDNALGEQADESAARMVHILGDRAVEVADLLRELADNPEHPLFQTIETQTMYGWNGDSEDWAKFQELARRIADGITATEGERAVKAIADVLTEALKESPDLKRLAHRLGLASPDRQTAEAALRDLAADIQAVAGAIASGRPADLAAAGKRIEGRAGALSWELGVLLSGGQEALNGAAGKRLGRQIDELIARLEQRQPDRNQEKYQFDASAAIADSLREAGITPLNDPRD
jgi:hypothetical protein